MNNNLLNNISLALSAHEYGHDVVTYAEDHDYTLADAALRLEQCNTFLSLFSSLGFSARQLEDISNQLT